MQYWLYKNNYTTGGPTGWWGDWECNFFTQFGPMEWGRTESFDSAEVHKYLRERIRRGHVIAAYQTDRAAIVGFARVVSVRNHAPPAKGVLAPKDDFRLELEPIHFLAEPFEIHERKVGTVLEHDSAVNGQPGIRPLTAVAMQTIVHLSGAPIEVLRGQIPGGRWIPQSPCVVAFELRRPGRRVEVEMRAGRLVIRDVDVDRRGNASAVRIRSEHESLQQALDACAEELESAVPDKHGQLVWILPGQEDIWVWPAESGGYVTGWGHESSDDVEFLGDQATVRAAIEVVADIIAEYNDPA
jgi:hypothetical protein